MAKNATYRKPGGTDRIQTILDTLDAEYPHAHIALSYRNPWELLVAVMLSAQCTDVVVNTVTANLFKKYPVIGDYLNADPEEFERDIRPTGFFRNKARNILAAARIVAGRYHGRVPRTMDAIISLPGVARKTANVVLANAYGVIDGIAVDTHVIRISQRWRLVSLRKIGGKKKVMFSRNGVAVIDFVKDADPVKIEKGLMNTLPRSHWFTFTYQIINHGRALCKAVRPRCRICPFENLCPVSRVTTGT